MEKVEFRVWDKKNKRYLNKVDNPVVVYDTGETAVRIGNPCNGEVELLYSGNYKIELFTGLLDKNGRKIYDGDIVRFPNLTRNELYQVIWWKESASFQLWGNGEFKNLRWNIETLCIEVIGNINENKELLVD